MSTFLFDEIIFGPVKSRRLGVSLGINLLPVSSKICNFDCVYCECGWTKNKPELKAAIPSRDEVFKALDQKLREMKKEGTSPDVITYAGNGEPTLHPSFIQIIDDSIELRNRYFPSARIAVLSNATRIGDSDIKKALLKVDMNILKLDSVSDKTITLHNQPATALKAKELIKNLRSFEGKLIIQTLFVRGSYNGNIIDNTTPEEIEGWLKAIEEIKPEEVMIYTISRDTPAEADLMKIPERELQEIAARVNILGIKTQVSG